MKLVLMSHFNLAEGMRNTLSYFNPYAAENMTAICAYINDCDPKVEFEKIVAEAGEDEMIIVFTDIMGGSVNQLTIPYLSRPNTYVFAGMNLGILLQATCLMGDETPEQIKALVETGKEAVVCMNDYKFEAYDDEDE